MVGFGAAILVQVIPKPPSATRNAARALSYVLADLTEFYAETISCVLAPDEDSPLKIKSYAEARIAELYRRLGDLRVRIAMVKFEPSTSVFTSAKLFQIHAHMGKILECLAVLAFLQPKLHHHYKRRLEHQTEYVSTETIADVMAVFGVLEGALKSGHALPEVLPVPLLGKLVRASKQNDIFKTLHRDMVKEDEVSDMRLYHHIERSVELD
jgi:hypothetical protein